LKLCFSGTQKQHNFYTIIIFNMQRENARIEARSQNPEFRRKKGIKQTKQAFITKHRVHRGRQFYFPLEMAGNKMFAYSVVSTTRAKRVVQKLQAA
jgi:hypothetical protein